MANFAFGGQVDFQVQALIGATHRGYNANATNQLDMYPFVFDGETSGWSSVQTLTIPESSQETPVPTPPNTQNSTVLGLDWVQLALLTLLGAIVVLLVVVVVFLRKRSVK